MSHIFEKLYPAVSLDATRMKAFHSSFTHSTRVGRLGSRAACSRSLVLLTQAFRVLFRGASLGTESCVNLTGETVREKIKVVAF